MRKDAEGIFETPGGGTTQLGGGQASGHQNEAPSLPLHTTVFCYFP